MSVSRAYTGVTTFGSDPTLTTTPTLLVPANPKRRRGVEFRTVGTAQSVVLGSAADNVPYLIPAAGAGNRNMLCIRGTGDIYARTAVGVTAVCWMEF